MRQKQEQDFMTQQMSIQSGSIEKMAAQGVDGTTIKDIAKQYTMQRALDRSDAKVESAAQADAAMANLNTFKEAEERERRHQVDMTGQSAKMMDAAKQNWLGFSCLECELKDVVWATPNQISWFGDDFNAPI